MYHFLIAIDLYHSAILFPDCKTMWKSWFQFPVPVYFFLLPASLLYVLIRNKNKDGCTVIKVYMRTLRVTILFSVWWTDCQQVNLIKETFFKELLPKQFVYACRSLNTMVVNNLKLLYQETISYLSRDKMFPRSDIFFLMFIF